MKQKKSFTIIIILLLLISGGYFGWEYYLDNIKDPEISPKDVVLNYFNALTSKDHKLAFTMVSEKHYFESFNQFIDRVSMYAPDMKFEIINENIVDKTANVTIKMQVPLKFGVYTSDGSMDLVRDKRVWKIIHP